MTTCVYTLRDFDKIYQGGRLEDISEDVIHSILTLTDSISSNVVENKKPYFKDKRHGRDRKDFEFERKFPSTFKTNFSEITSTNELSNIRNALNKISQKNYDKQKEVISTNMKELLNDKASYSTNIVKIFEIFIEVVSSNSFFSQLYASLYKELLEPMTDFKDELDAHVKKCKANISTLKYINPEENYDEFCKYNKYNDSRKAFLSFIIQVNKCEGINIDTIFDIILDISDNVEKWKNDDSKINEIDEMIETLYLLLTSNIQEMYTHSSWDRIINDINKLSVIRKTNPEENKGISSRATFRCMDILENVKSK